MTLPAEATGAAPGRGRLTGRRVLVVGSGTRPSPEPDPPPGNGRAISVLAAREGAAVACADVMRQFLGFGKFDIGSMLMGSASSAGG